jgi:hypothetical protein
MLEKLARDKHPSKLGRLANYNCKIFYNIGLRIQILARVKQVQGLKIPGNKI